MGRENFQFNDTSASIFHHLTKTEDEEGRTYRSIIEATDLTMRRVQFSIVGLVEVSFVSKGKIVSLDARPAMERHPMVYYFTPTELGITAFSNYVRDRLDFYNALAQDIPNTRE